MDYLVNAENTPYYHWQLELLIESFKRHNCEENLFICLAETDENINPMFWKNIPEHKRIQGHENIGKIRGYNALNNLYALMWANQFNWVKQPFVHIPADVVLNKQLNIQFSEYPEIIFAPSPFFTIDAAEEVVGPFWELFDKEKSFYEKSWVPMGPIAVFSNIPAYVFERTTILAEKLALHQLLDGKEIWEHTDKIAWAINLADFIGQIKLTGNYSMTMTMLNDGDAPFIHYEHGLPPVFNKTMFQYSTPNFVSFGDPYEILSQHSPTQSAHFISQLAKTLLEAR